MVCEKAPANSFLSNLAIHKKSKGNLFHEKPIFCNNGASIVVPCGKSCHLYNTSTGNHIQELFQCPDDIISCQLHPQQSSKVIAVTENGELIMFNLETNTVNQTIKLRLNSHILNKWNTLHFSEDEDINNKNLNWETQQLHSVSYRKFVYAEVRECPNISKDILIWATWSLLDEIKCHLSVFKLKDGEHVDTRAQILHTTGYQKRYLNFVLGTALGWDLFVGMCTNHVLVVKFDARGLNFFRNHIVGGNGKLSCVAMHPVECSFATGDSLGRIVIWKNIFDRHPLKDVCHWHTLPVHDLFFSKFGNYLFSGGEENVLVKWSLSTRNKDFFPRLSSTIHHISGFSESCHLTVSTMDNQILILNFNFQCVATIQHFSRWSLAKENNNLNFFTIDPRSHCLVLKGRIGHIQFLSLAEEGKFVYTFDVTNRNIVTSTSDILVENLEVTHAKFTKSGKWLVTGESLGNGKECRLKFWTYCEEKGSYMLNTNVEMPHGDGAIYSLEIGQDDRVATTGADQKFRLWGIVKQEGKPGIWSVIGLGKHRNLPSRAVDFSKDSSLVAVTFGPVLTIWETDSCILKCTLSTTQKKEDLKFCKFGNNELSHLVVTGSEYSIVCWNSITLSMIWTVPFSLSVLVSDSFSVYMAAFSSKNTLVVFSPSSPVPAEVFKNVCDLPVVAAQPALNDTGRFCLYFITSGQDLYCLEDAEKMEAEAKNGTETSVKTPFSTQLAKIRNMTESDKKKILLNRSNKQLASKLLDSPAHTLPNPSLLCSDILKALLVFSDIHPVMSLKNEKIDRENVLEVNHSSGDVENSSLEESKLEKIVDTIFR